MTTIVFSQVQNNLFAAVNSRLFYIHKDTNNEIKNAQSHQEKKTRQNTVDRNSR